MLGKAFLLPAFSNSSLQKLVLQIAKGEREMLKNFLANRRAKGHEMPAEQVKREQERFAKTAPHEMPAEQIKREQERSAKTAGKPQLRPGP